MVFDGREKIMLTYDMEKRGKIPRYDYLYRCIKADILAGRLKSGERLPSKRAIAEHLAVSIITVENAYAQLESEGYVAARPRSGYYVCPAEYLPAPPAAVQSPPSDAAQNAFGAEMNGEETDGNEADGYKDKKWKYDFASNRIDPKYFPFSVWSRLMRETLSYGGAELLRGSPFNGEVALRQAISEYLLRSRGIVAPPERIVVGAGTEYLYGLVVQILGRERVYAVEDPSYPKIAQVYRANGARVVHVKTDGQGVRADLLENTPATVLHVSPSHHYPTGVVTGFTRRSELLAWAARKGGYVIEDDYDSEFRLAGKPIQPMQALDTAGRVVYVNTFSRTLAPSMRIGYMVLPEGLMKKFRGELGFYACTVPVFEQLTLAKFIAEGHFERHLSRMRNIYRKKRDEAIRLFTERGYPLHIAEEDAGLHFLVRLDTDLADEEVRRLAAERGVKLAFLSDFAAEGGEAIEHCIVVNYSDL